MLSSAWGRFYFSCKRATFTPHTLWQDTLPAEWLLRKFQDDVWVHPNEWLVSRRLTELAGPWDERLSLDDDGEYFCRIVAVSERVTFVGAARSYYRIGNVGSLAWGRSAKAAESLQLATALCIGHLESRTCHQLVVQVPGSLTCSPIKPVDIPPCPVAVTCRRNIEG